MSQDKPSSQQPETHEPYQDQDQGRGKKQGDERAQRRDDKDGDSGRKEDDGHDDQPPERDQPQQQQPSMMKNLLMTAGVALICGVIGAAGYLYFLGAKPEESPSSQKKPDSESAKEATENKKSGFSGTESVMESNSRGASSIPGFTASVDADTLKKQIADLMQRVDGLSARVDRMTRPKDETPPVLHTMQIKMAELARVMDEVASLPAKVRYCDNRLETMQEEIKTLRSRIESLTGGRVEGLNANLALPRPSSAAAPPATDNQAESPTMELGITLLERGQYASAREVFLRLERAQPRDALVWYFGALAAGLTSGDWNGEAKQFVEKGIERERAGTPPTAQIDAVRVTRTPIEGEPWLNSLRRQALNANRTQ